MENKLISLYAFAEEQGIDVDWFPMMATASLSMPLPGDTYGIAIDPWKMETVAQEIVSLAHELGHCQTGSFYNRKAALDVVERPLCARPSAGMPMATWPWRCMLDARQRADKIKNVSDSDTLSCIQTPLCTGFHLTFPQFAVILRVEKGAADKRFAPIL